jgi:endonuclease YncB( thermonuclease family)
MARCVLWPKDVSSIPLRRGLRTGSPNTGQPDASPLATRCTLRHCSYMPSPLTLIASSALTLCTAPIVHDGDTIRCGRERVRLVNIDAPELLGSERCSPASRRRLAGSRNPAWCDYDLGERSRAALAALIVRGPAMLQPVGRDHYGRLLARVTVNGRDAGAYLISRGLARPWR